MYEERISYLVGEINKLIAKHNNKLNGLTKQKNEILRKQNIQEELTREIDEQRNYYKERETINKIKKDDLENKIALVQRKVTEFKLTDDINFKDIKKNTKSMQTSRIEIDDMAM
jgi:hypothetical protein